MASFRITCLVQKGIGKAECDDTALIGDLVVNEDAVQLEFSAPGYVCLCDGVGGNAGGRDASLFVCTHMGMELKALNQQLLAYGKQIGKPKMATTLTGLHFEEGGITLMHAGNTRLYRFTGGFLAQLTADHTTYEWLKSIGSFEAAEACNKSEIRCALGGGRPEYLKGLVEKPIFGQHIPRTLLLTTDGIHDYLTLEEMEEILAKKDASTKIVRQLVESAVQKGSKDDCSALLMEAMTF